MAQQPDPYGSPPPQDTSSNGDVARQQGEHVKDEVTQQAQAVAGTVADEAAHVAHEAADHVRDLAADAKQQLHRQAREQTDHLGGALGELGDRVHALADGRPQDAGPVSDYADRIADRVDGIANRVSDLGFDGMIDEGQRFARRRPGAFLAAAAVAGFAASRLGRGVQASQQEQDHSDTTVNGGPSAALAAPRPPSAPMTPSALPGPSPRLAAPSSGTTPPPVTPPSAGRPVEKLDPPRDPAATPWSSEQVRR